MDTHHGASPTTAATAVANKPVVFSKMETLVREMQDAETGIPIRSQKLFLTSIPSAFMGYDLIEWLMDRLEIEDSAEAIHLANLLCQYGYFFPVGETRSLMVKDDSSLYRFQTPYYWASQNHSADTTDYAIYLTKRLARNKQKHGLEDYELEAYNKLKKGLQHKWDFVLMQAEEQARLAKDRKKGDKIVTDSQERAYWRVYRPPPGYTNCLENAPIPDRNNMANRVKKKTVDSVKQEIELVGKQIERTRMKVSVAAESLISHGDTYFEYDFFMVAPQPANPWITDDPTFWVLNENLVDVPTEKRVKRWSLSFAELVSDPTGLNEFTVYLRKEYCHENIRFWQAVTDLRYGPAVEVTDKVNSIYEEFLKPGAPCEINIDGKTMEGTQQMMKTPTRYTYDLAAEHVYVLLLKKDCYPRFLRSEHYKNLLTNAIQPSQKKRFFSFGGPGKKKTTAVAASNSVTLQAQTPQPLKRHGSDEQTAGGAPGGGSQVTVEGHLGIGAALGVLQPRVDCEPPYSSIERSSVVTEQTGDSSEVCPWESTSSDAVCPWEGVPLPQPRLPSQQPPMQRLQQSLPPPKQQLVKPRQIADRSKSMDLNPTGSQRPQSTSFAPSLDPIRGSSPSEVSPVAGEKAQSVDVCPWESQSPTQKASGVLSSPKDPVLTALAPAGVAHHMTERRASEGVLRMALGVCPWDEVLKPVVVKEEPSEELHEEERDHSTITISVIQSGLEGKPNETTPSPTKGKFDLTIRSGQVEPELSSGATDLKSPTVSESTQSPTLPKEAITESGRSYVPQLLQEQQIEPLSSQTVEAVLVEIEKQQEPTVSSPGTAAAGAAAEVVTSWEDTQPQKTADVCPWEDDSLTPTWL